MTTPPIILVPGFWLGAWAWDEVATLLRAGGHEVSALTLPGLDSIDTDRSTITLADHVEAICEAIREAGRPVVLAVHSGAAVSGYAATDRVPELIGAMVYVDTAPAARALDPDFQEIEKPLPSAEELAAEENLDGLTPEHLATFRARAVPEPGAAMRDDPRLANDARRDIPSTIICTGFSAAEYQASISKGWAFLSGVPELRKLTWIDLPTSHWPMWSRPADLAAILGDIAAAAAEGWPVVESDRGHATGRRASAEV